MTGRHAEYDATRNDIEQSQLDYYVGELLEEVESMKASIGQSETSLILIEWVRDKIVKLHKDFQSQ